MLRLRHQPHYAMAPASLNARDVMPYPVRRRHAAAYPGNVIGDAWDQTFHQLRKGWILSHRVIEGAIRTVEVYTPAATQISWVQLHLECCTVRPGACWGSW